MGIFDKVLRSDESVFKVEIALNYDYQPKLIPYREKQQFKIVNCIKPLFNNMNGRNLIITGLPGIGKTVATKHVLAELEEETTEIIPIYINCWQKQTTYKIFVDICNQLEFKFIQNKRTEELLEIIKKILNKKAAVFVFDEIDKTDDPNFLYSLIEEIHYKSIICITNYKSWVSTLDKRIMSRLMPETIEFLPYNKVETEGILNERIRIAFVPEVWDKKALSIIVEKTSELKDIRTGLYLLKEAGLCANDRSSKKIEEIDVKKALEKIPDFKIKNTNELENDLQIILEIVKKNSGSKIGELYKIYESNEGKGSYKTFQRKIAKLKESKFIKTKKIIGGEEGSTTIVSYDTATKQLSDF